MRYTYKVRELGPEVSSINEETGGIEVHVNVGEAKEMEAMSLKKLRRKLDPKKKYFIHGKDIDSINTSVRRDSYTRKV